MGWFHIPSATRTKAQIQLTLCGVIIELTNNMKLFMSMYNPKSEKVGTVWKTQIKKESSDF